MLKFKAALLKFDKQGEKTGWTYIEVPIAVTEKMKPGQKTAYRVKGKMDDHPFEHVSLIPMGNGQFIIAINAAMRKGLQKRKGDTMMVLIEADDRPITIDADFLQCLQDEPAANEFFSTLTQGHRNYFSKWIESAKTEATKAKRIAQAVNGLAKKFDYSQMIRANKEDRELL